MWFYKGNISGEMQLQVENEGRDKCSVSPYHSIRGVPPPESLCWLFRTFTTIHWCLRTQFRPDGHEQNRYVRTHVSTLPVDGEQPSQN